MKHIEKVVLTVLLAGSQLLAQVNPQELLHQACAFEKQGQFDKAIAIAKQLTGSGRLSGLELGRAWIVLGVAYKDQGKFAEGQKAFEQSLHILEGDPRFVTDYSAALENYGELYNDAGQLGAAAQMWEKALRLRQQSNDYAGATRSLMALAGVALARKQIHEAKKYMENAAAEMKFAHDLTDDDSAIAYETQAWLALAEGHPSTAVAGYQRALDLSKRNLGERHWITGWDYMLLGKAYSQSGDADKALADMREGLSILDQALGRKHPKYFAAQIAYAQVLDRAGLSEQAAQWRAAGEQGEKDFYRSQCVGCTINVAGFR
jgi:tetratricopeptide (TPR) repeat protein